MTYTIGKLGPRQFFLSLILMCPYILILGFYFINAAATIQCPYLARPHMFKL